MGIPDHAFVLGLLPACLRGCPRPKFQILAHRSHGRVGSDWDCLKRMELKGRQYLREGTSHAAEIYPRRPAVNRYFNLSQVPAACRTSLCSGSGCLKLSSFPISAHGAWRPQCMLSWRGATIWAIRLPAVGEPFFWKCWTSIQQGASASLLSLRTFGKLLCLLH